MAISWHVIWQKNLIWWEFKARQRMAGQVSPITPGLALGLGTDCPDPIGGTDGSPSDLSESSERDWTCPTQSPSEPWVHFSSEEPNVSDPPIQ